MPTGLLNISLVGLGKAKLIVFNRKTKVHEELITPSATNYVTSIANWRDTYCDPNTLYVRSALVPLDNGL